MWWDIFLKSHVPVTNLIHWNNALQISSICDPLFNLNFHPSYTTWVPPPIEHLIANYEYVRDLFQNTPGRLSTAEEEIFIDLTSSGEIEACFSDKPFFEFWAGVDGFFPLKTKASRIVLPFINPTFVKSDFLWWLL